MSKYSQFIFKDWDFDQSTKILSLYYSYDNSLNFTETFHFDFEFAPSIDQSLLDQACQTLFMMAGVSYYKAYLAPIIAINKGQLDNEAAKFFSKTYQKGLGEFFYINRLGPNLSVSFPVVSSASEPIHATPTKGLLIGIGGGKDSLLTTEILKDQPRVATWSLGHRQQLSPLISAIGLPHFWVDRQWDRQLLELNKQGALNGHIPISAIFAAVGNVVAVLADYSDAIVSNESSANEPNLEYNGVAINHQHSKSLEFEKDFQSYLQHTMPGMHYYSFLRPLTEVRISELFATHSFDTYSSVFSSCNRAFTHASDHMFWCGECAKCAFTFLALTPFLPRKKVEALWSGKNLLLDSTLEPTYRQLLGIEGDKPLDCVGEVKEARTAMRLAQMQYPELAKYVFDIPEDYDYKQLSPHSMPEDMYQILLSYVA